MNHKTDFKVIGIESKLLDDIIAGRKNIEGRLNKGKHNSIFVNLVSLYNFKLS
jgi:ASC-1-like (ASCH) protein